MTLGKVAPMGQRAGSTPQIPSAVPAYIRYDPETGDYTFDPEDQDIPLSERAVFARVAEGEYELMLLSDVDEGGIVASLARMTTGEGADVLAYPRPGYP